MSDDSREPSAQELSPQKVRADGGSQSCVSMAPTSESPAAFLFPNNKPRRKRSNPGQSSSLLEKASEASENITSLNGSETELSLSSKRGSSRRSSTMPSLSSSSSRSHLFPGADASMLAPATVMGSQDTQDAYSSPSKTPRMSGSNKSTQSSLFGAVMKNVHDQSSGLSTHQPYPSTPKASFRDFVASPGGFQMMDFVNSVGTSPLKQSKQDPPQSTTPRRQVEWHQTTITKRSVRLIDWSLKSKLDFQCQPGLNLHHCDASLQQQAMLQFLGRCDAHNDSGKVQWQEGLFYWQHPAVPSPLRTENNSSQDAAKSLQPPPTRNEKVMEQKQHWQEAFQSLFANWMQQVRRLAKGDWKASDELADTYFYAVGNVHVVLFRCGVESREGDDSSSFQLVPEIVLSSSTKVLREKLRAMGARWQLLAPFDCHTGEFHEAMLDTKQPTDRTAADESPSKHSKADLIALRRAQAFGQTAGADVSFSMRSKTGNAWPRGRVPPLYLSGMDDCLAFCEVYLNTLGQISTGQTWRTQCLSHEVPLLVCRKLGPFLHSTMRQARCLNQRRPSGFSGGDDAYTSFEVSGLLLPCAVRTLVSALTRSMITNQTTSALVEERGDSEESSGSHHAILHLTQQSRKAVGVGSIGDSSSRFFNSESRLWEACEDDYQCCQYEESVQTAIWDIDRPTDLAYKLEYNL